MELSAFAPPGPDRAFQVRGVDDYAEKAILADRIMRRPHLQGHLMIGPKVDGLNIAPGTEIPEMDLMAVLVREQVFRNDAVLKLRRKAPLARHHVVARQVPPEIVVELLGAAVDFPAAEDIECLAVHDEDAWRSIGTILPAAAERADIDALRTTMDGVWPRIAGLSEDLVGLDDLMDTRPGRMRLGVHHVNAR